MDTIDIIHYFTVVTLTHCSINTLIPNVVRFETSIEGADELNGL